MRTSVLGFIPGYQRTAGVSRCIPGERSPILRKLEMPVFVVFAGVTVDFVWRTAQLRPGDQTFPNKSSVVVRKS
ncbi:hypothetical protein RRG08_014099 [Elysia crispata]|uniref:Uncharacterized protein n=1 Tax=Elysia crispata TaxID=231223 RepID=A0AAE0XQT0_9GAST|nr:hypothetical protein RRG08_014099 [Elysia crispata]